MRRGLSAVAFALLASPCSAAVDLPISPGVWVAHGRDAGLGVGLGVSIPLRALYPGLRLAGGFTNHFRRRGPEVAIGGPSGTTTREDRRAWQLDADLIWELTRRGSAPRPWLGAGMGYAHTTVTANLVSGPPRNRYTHVTSTASRELFARAVAGSAFCAGSVAPFVQAALGFRDSPDLLIVAGVRF